MSLPLLVLWILCLVKLTDNQLGKQQIILEIYFRTLEISFQVVYFVDVICVRQFVAQFSVEWMS